VFQDVTRPSIVIMINGPTKCSINDSASRSFTTYSEVETAGGEASRLVYDILSIFPGGDCIAPVFARAIGFGGVLSRRCGKERRQRTEKIPTICWPRVVASIPYVVLALSVRRLIFMTLAVLLLGACGKKVRISAQVPARDPGTRPAARPDSSGPTSTSPASGASNSAGVERAESELVGLASYYAEPYHGRRTANGETFDTYEALTAAHRTLPFNTLVRVTNENNGRDVDVRINDRGPFIDGRVIDLSLKAANEIDMVRAGIVPVHLRILQEGAPPPAAVYAIQVGAFENQDAAESLKRDLEQRYRDVTVQSVSTAKTFYRVRVGRTADLKSAERLARQLRDESFDPFVVRLN